MAAVVAGMANHQGLDLWWRVDGVWPKLLTASAQAYLVAFDEGISGDPIMYVQGKTVYGLHIGRWWLRRRWVLNAGAGLLMFNVCR